MSGLSCRCQLLLKGLLWRGGLCGRCGGALEGRVVWGTQEQILDLDGLVLHDLRLSSSGPDSPSGKFIAISVPVIARSLWVCVFHLALDVAQILLNARGGA